jgi:hypothetical protein
LATVAAADGGDVVVGDHPVFAEFRRDLACFRGERLFFGEGRTATL